MWSPMSATKGLESYIKKNCQQRSFEIDIGGLLHREASYFRLLSQINTVGIFKYVMFSRYHWNSVACNHSQGRAVTFQKQWQCPTIHILSTVMYWSVITT
jgi:hypothetical protein